jgi:hypothetical protein
MTGNVETNYAVKLFYLETKRKRTTWTYVKNMGKMILMYNVKKTDHKGSLK